MLDCPYPLAIIRAHLLIFHDKRHVEMTTALSGNQILETYPLIHPHPRRSANLNAQPPRTLFEISLRLDWKSNDRDRRYTRGTLGNGKKTAHLQMALLLHPSSQLLQSPLGTAHFQQQGVLFNMMLHTPSVLRLARNLAQCHGHERYHSHQQVPLRFCLRQVLSSSRRITLTLTFRRGLALGKLRGVLIAITDAIHFHPPHFKPTRPPPCPGRCLAHRRRGTSGQEAPYHIKHINREDP